ncbi:MAG: hypothetical protein GY759_03265 [Chloroflexi bacterium]|nr:hypothetical protein [Chloroflexota bacterium]
MEEHAHIQQANMDWPWKNEDPLLYVILVSDEQLLTIANDPDEPIENIHPHAEKAISLREHCRQGAAKGASNLRIAFDYFFGGSERSLYPDTPLFQDALKKVHDVAQEFGLGLEPSILSPLELGVGYKQWSGESGRWMHYREGLRDAETGQYSVALWQQTRWTNNKGPMPVTLAGVRAFAFNEERIPGTTFFAVNPDEIVELDTPIIETISGTDVDVGDLDGGNADARAMFKAQHLRVHGSGGPQRLERVLVVLLYETVEMDYFSPSAAVFLDELVEQYHSRGISLAGIYSDEMHIQQDWSYHSHMDNGQFTVRYVSKGFEQAFARAFGAEYSDFAKYMVYFASHQHDFLPTHEPKLPAQHVFGNGEQDIAKTLLFRSNYYDFLEQSVVKLMVDAREKLEALNGRAMDAFYHATWAESPTCDAWAIGGVFDSWSPEEHRRRYEYTPDFVWSNTVHQAASACANYFAWNDYLSGGNVDTAEGGYSDRNYFGRALACSLAVLNRRPLASAGMWGMPPEVRQRMDAVSEVFGAGGHATYRAVADYQTREIETLFLYPQDLVSVDEQFGSWMVQYGYANYISADKLTTHAQVGEGGILHVNGCQYRTLCVLYEPFPSSALLALIKQFVEKGGCVVWSSMPPMLDREGRPIGEAWMQDVFGVKVVPATDPLGLAVPARQVCFEDILSHIAPMTILTDFIVDRVFPVTPVDNDTTVVATIRTGGAANGRCLGARKVYPGGGQALYLGLRPRDDQAACTGLEISTWFDILNALGAYPSSHKEGANDNPTVLSRNSNYVVSRFANEAIALAPHYRHHEESWPGGFFRDAEIDAQVLLDNPLPEDVIDLQNWPVAGQTLSYQGKHAVIWRRNRQGDLIGFAGEGCTGIELDGRSWAWTDQPIAIAWHPLSAEHATSQFEPLYRLWVGDVCNARIPLRLPADEGLEIWAGAQLAGANAMGQETDGRVGYAHTHMPFTRTDSELLLDIDADFVSRWLYVVLRK